MQYQQLEETSLSSKSADISVRLESTEPVEALEKRAISVGGCIVLCLYEDNFLWKSREQKGEKQRASALAENNADILRQPSVQDRSKQTLASPRPIRVLMKTAKGAVTRFLATESNAPPVPRSPTHGRERVPRGGRSVRESRETCPDQRGTCPEHRGTCPEHRRTFCSAVVRTVGRRLNALQDNGSAVSSRYKLTIAVRELSHGGSCYARNLRTTQFECRYL